MCMIGCMERERGNQHQHVEIIESMRVIKGFLGYKNTSNNVNSKKFI